MLLRNQNGVLPLDQSPRNILVIGGHADAGVLSGAGSAQVIPPEGPALDIHTGGEGQFAALRDMVWHKASPLVALKEELPRAHITFNDGRDVGEAAALSRNADLVIVFATQWMMESYDAYDLCLPNGQDGLIGAVASANPHTVVVLETGGPVTMPWRDKTAAIVEAWYPGADGGHAIANVLTGAVNPSGRLPITFPASIEQLPRPLIPGFGEPDQAQVKVDYNIEGADVGYRWFFRKQVKPLFPFGGGLSYTEFSYSDLKVESTAPLKVSFTVSNVGTREGEDVPQLYLTDVPGRRQERLLGWEKLSLSPGASQRLTLNVDPRLLADFNVQDQRWHVAGGGYHVALGHSSEDLPLKASAVIDGFIFPDSSVSKSN